jgi:uncharacterized protein (DUF2062 family)
MKPPTLKQQIVGGIVAGLVFGACVYLLLLVITIH